MSPERIAIAALIVSLIGHAISFGMLMIHCRRDKSRFKRLEDWN